jgi:hypothetical protein
MCMNTLALEVSQYASTVIDDAGLDEQHEQSM